MRYLLIFLTLIACGQARESFNDNWTFFNAEAPGAEKPDFDHSGWRQVNLPHDWAIEGPFNIKYNARSGGLPFHGTGWYRKSFNIPASDNGKRIAVTFDGAMYDAHIWINGHFLGHRPFGYIGFQYDLSAHLNYGGENVIAVRLRPEDLSSRWYPGAGLYRNTWLTKTDKLHLPLWGTTITTPTIEKDHAEVLVKLQIKNHDQRQRNGRIEIQILSPDGNPVITDNAILPLASGEELAHTFSLSINNPKLWDLKTPHLYTAVVTLGEDKTETKFGIRTVEYIAGKGLHLNGKHVPINGVCMHHDLGPLGAAVNRRATERQLEIMKSMGVNSIRTSHNPPSPEQLEFCDQLGILVQVEAFDCWEMPKIPNGYNKFFRQWHERDLRDMIRRDRNHPCVIMWSIGNEILEQRKKDGWKLARRLHRICKDEDPTRLTSAGFNMYPTAIKNGLAAEVDIPGLNYKPMSYADTHAKFPDWHILASETSSCTSSRGVYHLPLEKYKTYTDNQVTSYDLIGPVWAYPPDIEFMALAKTPSVLGEYVWTGFDYLGEPTPYGGRDNSTNGYWNADWPSRSSYFGTVDLCGLPKDRFFLYQSQWTSVKENPMVHLLPHWNWKESKIKTIPVYAYTNGDEAELFLNGKSLGKKRKGVDKTDLLVDFMWWPGHKEGKPEQYASPYRLHWDVPYEPGELKVVAYQEGTKIAEKAHHTAGSPSQIALHPERKNIGEEIGFVVVEILDANGHLCPRATNLVNFEIEGDGEIVAVGNGNSASVESFQAHHRKAFSGKCVVIVKGNGPFLVKASSPGLKASETSIIGK